MTAGVQHLSTVAPGRTFALIVGIEEYAAGHRWSLPGPARDALRFAQWLTGPAGIPLDNVRLFLSPLSTSQPDWNSTAQLGALKDRFKSATAEHIESALFGDLPGRDGNLLWIYWAGHGFIDKRRRLLLPYADAIAGKADHLDLESALGWWRSSMVPRARFPFHAAIVDACRVSAARAGGLNFGSVDYGGDDCVPSRRQFMLYAARPGEAAKNEADRRAGQFTEALLEQLGEKPLAECVTGLVGIARAVRERFEAMRAAGTAWQLPEFVVSRDWDGSVLFDEDWAAGPRAPRLDQQAWDELDVLVGDRELPEHAYDAYRWAFKTSGCAVPSLLSLPKGGLSEVLQDLDERQGARPDLPLPVPFVRFLAARARPADPDWADRLDRWVAATRARLGCAPLPPPPPAGARGYVVHVRLEESDVEDHYRARMWLYHGTFEQLWETEGPPLRLAAIRQILSEKLLMIANRFSDASQHSAPRLDRVEFHVPFHLLDAEDDPDTEFERWQIPVGRRGKCRELGQLYQVAVRCPDERIGLTRGRWTEKWKWFKTQGGQHPQAVRLLTESDLTDSLAMALQADVPPVCVLAEVSNRLEALDALVEAGVPVAVWRRGGRPRYGPDQGLAAALAPPQNRGALLDVRTLPARVRELRIAHAGEGPPDWRYPLALLWDDPDSRPGSESWS